MSFHGMFNKARALLLIGAFTVVVGIAISLPGVSAAGDLSAEATTGEEGTELLPSTPEGATGEEGTDQDQVDNNPCPPVVHVYKAVYPSVFGGHLRDVSVWVDYVGVRRPWVDRGWRISNFKFEVTHNLKDGIDGIFNPGELSEGFVPPVRESSYPHGRFRLIPPIHGQINPEEALLLKFWWGGWVILIRGQERLRCHFPKTEIPFAPPPRPPRLQFIGPPVPIP